MLRTVTVPTLANTHSHFHAQVQGVARMIDQPYSGLHTVDFVKVVSL